MESSSLTTDGIFRGAEIMKSEHLVPTIPAFDPDHRSCNSCSPWLPLLCHRRQASPISLLARFQANLMRKSAITAGSLEAKCPESVTIKKEKLEEKTVCEERPSLTLNVVVKSSVKRKNKNCAIDLARELIDHHAMVMFCCFHIRSSNNRLSH